MNYTHEELVRVFCPEKKRAGITLSDRQQDLVGHFLTRLKAVDVELTNCQDVELLTILQQRRDLLVAEIGDVL